jgi:hypothetical protein
METPKLVDNSVKRLLSYSLQKCHTNRINIYSFAFNIFVLSFFIAFFGITLYYCYKKKPSLFDKECKMMKEQEYVLSKIRYYQQIKQHQKETYSKLTDLPIVENTQ